MSLSPPRKPNIGAVWVDPFDARRYIFTGEIDPRLAHMDAFDGWTRWDLRNEQHEYERGTEETSA